MRAITLVAPVLGLAMLGGCASSGGGYGWRSACERDYDNNRAAATAAGAILGAAAGAAVAKNDGAGAAVGGVAGGIIGNQLARKDDPCGYGFTGYYRDDGRYGQWDERRGRWRR